MFKGARLSALRNGHFYPQDIFLVLISVGGLVDPGPMCGRKDYANQKIQVTVFSRIFIKIKGIVDLIIIIIIIVLTHGGSTVHSHTNSTQNSEEEIQKN
jgi:hypothetical protein